MADKTYNEVTITLPCQMVLDATARTQRFTPYKENFVTPVAKGTKLALDAVTVGQYLYYIKQGFVDNTVAKLTVDEGNGDVIINAPATVTITNNTTKVMNFIPYRENFSYSLEPKDKLSFVVKTAGQSLYYLAQDTTGPDAEGGLDVTQVKATAKEADEGTTTVSGNEA